MESVFQDHQLDLEAERSSEDSVKPEFDACGGSESAEAGLIKQDRKADVCQTFSPESVTDGCVNPEGVPAAERPFKAAASDTEEPAEQQTEHQIKSLNTLNSAASSKQSTGDKLLFMSAAPLSDQVSSVHIKTIIYFTFTETSVCFSSVETRQQAGGTRRSQFVRRIPATRGVGQSSSQVPKIPSSCSDALQIGKHVCSAALLDLKRRTNAGLLFNPRFKPS